MDAPFLYFHPATQLFLDSKLGVLRYDAASQSLVLKRRVCKQALDILACLLAHDNRLITRGQLLADAWPGRIVTRNALDVTIARLRAALMIIDPHGVGLVTRRNVGYLFSYCDVGLVPVVSRVFLLNCLDWVQCRGVEPNAVSRRGTLHHGHMDITYP